MFFFLFLFFSDFFIFRGYTCTINYARLEVARSFFKNKNKTFISSHFGHWMKRCHYSFWMYQNSNNILKCFFFFLVQYLCFFNESRWSLIVFFVSRFGNQICFLLVNLVLNISKKNYIFTILIHLRTITTATHTLKTKIIIYP